jgi:hypothetical protein
MTGEGCTDRAEARLTEKVYRMAKKVNLKGLLLP